MELRLFAANARLAVARSGGFPRASLRALLLLSLLLSAAPAPADYLYPADARGGYLETPSATQADGGPAKTGAPVRYRSFAGTAYDLTEHRGRYVTVLLPAAPAAGPFFTAEHVVELVERLDLLYALYREIIGLEPGGSGLLSVAFVAQTCGTGCGLLGARGIEIRTDPDTYAAIIRELDAGRLDAILVHEMVHNFDAYAAHLHYLPDHPHAWTDFFQYFAAHRYGRIVQEDQAPDDVYRSPVSVAWQDYLADDSANWTSCVQDGACGDRGLSANNVWAMPYYRLESLYGADAVLRSFAFLSDYVRTRPAPATDTGKESLRLLSLAVGAGANIACHLEFLKWPLEDSLRSELQSRFGGDDPACLDLDRDSFVPVNGDCDENDPSRHLHGAELAGNRRDDDCDGLTDETALVEAEQGPDPDNFAGVVRPGLPFEVQGSAADSGDNDIFSFPPGSSGRVFATLCARGDFRGWAAALDADGDFIARGSWYIYQPQAGCSSATFDYGGQAVGMIAVMPDDAAGGYALTVGPAAPLPRDHSVLLAAVPRAAGGVTLRVGDARGELAALGAETLELAISGTDLRWTLPYTATAAVAVDRARAPQLSDGGLYRARLRPLAGGRPLLPFSAGHLFRFDGGPAVVPQLDHGYSGAWFDPTHRGEGFIVEVLENARALVYWFTYQWDGRQRWLIGTGEIDGSRIVVDELLDAGGGRFGDAFDPADVTLRTVGSLSIGFLDCATALVNYSVDNIGGSQALQRLAGIDGHRCDSAAPPPAADISGSWYDPAHDGEGFVVQRLEGGRAAVYWFTYDAEGNQAWLHDTGTIEGERIVFEDLLQPAGGRFGRSFDPADVRLAPWGALELELDCAGGTASYRPSARGYAPGTQRLVSLTRLQGSGCAR
ncbi:MAG: hypothetical protein EHM68_02810 [Lysobacterales bacterium]|nr:MAG: hypothetical protein EHM68_02810 [Xanthomonadales bacterium]